MLLSHLDSYISTRLVFGKQSPSDTLSDHDTQRERQALMCGQTRCGLDIMSWCTCRKMSVWYKSLKQQCILPLPFSGQEDEAKHLTMNLTPLKKDGGTPQSPLASGLRAPFLLCYKMNTCPPQAEVQLTGSRALNVCVYSLRSEYNSAGGPGPAGEDWHPTLPQLLLAQHTVHLAHDGKSQLPQEHPPHP